MKHGNQFYLEFQIEDKQGGKLDINAVKKVQFNINELTKTYDGLNNEVTYENGIFKIWLTEDETFNFSSNVKVDARILFTNDTIMGTYIENYFFFYFLKNEELDV